MDIGVPNSFIPHDATTPQKPVRYDSSGGLGELLSLISIVLFVASAALAAGSFLYLQYLDTQNSQKQAEIQQAQAAFDPTLIKQLTTLDNRMNAANTILAAHIAPSAFFAALDQTTAATVSFQNMDLDATNPSNITLKMTGVARDINSIAFQADLFGKSGVINDAIFSGIDQQADGVHFNVTATVNPATMSYETLVTGQTPAGQNALPQTSTQSGTQATTQTSAAATSPFGTATQSAQATSPTSATLPTTQTSIQPQGATQVSTQSAQPIAAPSATQSQGQTQAAVTPTPSTAPTQ